MRKPSHAKHEETKPFEINKDSPSNANAIELEHDPDYEQLLTAYQAGDFKRCEHLIEALIEKYPGHPALFKFREELTMKLSIKDLNKTIEKEEKKIKRMSAFSVVLVGMISILLIIVTLFLSLIFFSGTLSSPDPANLEPTEMPLAAELELLYNQADALLQSGQPGQVERIIEIFLDINPEYPNLDELQTRFQTMLRLEAQYQEASNLVEAGELSEALELFKSIEAEHPGLWDVRQQIETIEEALQIETFLNDDNFAYHNENWLVSINTSKFCLVDQINAVTWEIENSEGVNYKWPG